MFSNRFKKYSQSKRDRHTDGSNVPPDPVDFLQQGEDMANLSRNVPQQNDDGKLSKEHHGLFVLYPGTSTDIKADIVALHGLGGHAFKTWTDKHDHLWLRDSLPTHVPNTRIMTFGYDSATWSGSKSTILEFAIDLLERIRIIRQTDKEIKRPIVFICHSLGGLVCKKALIIAHEQPQYAPLLERVHGIIFMGTPHRGSKLASLATPLSNMINLAILKKRLRTDLLKNLEVSSTTITEISLSATHRLAPLEIVSFYEQKVLEPLGCRIVEPFSSILGLPNEKTLPISADHRDMVRLSPREAEKYRPVWTSVAEMIGNCRGPAEGQSDWIEARELLDALYIVDYSRFLLDTPIAHPGSCSWLLENEKFSDWLTSSGSGAFWLHGHPGRGKTVLARFIIETLKNIPDSYPKLHNLKSFKVIHYILLEQDKERGSITKILRSLLHQFILEDPSLASTIQHLFGLERKLTKPHENCDTLWNAIRGILALEALKRAVIIIDALDELDPGTLAALINGFSSIILHLRERLPDRKIKIVVTSRPDECIDKLLNKINPVKLEISSNDGVASFIRNEVLAFGERYQFPDRISQQIITEIVNKADGMFLWASLAWANFQEGVTFWSTRTIDTQLEALQKQPRGLESLYSSILSKINQKTLQELRPLFQCVIAAHRPLSCTEMAEALAVQTCDNHRELITVFSIAKSIDKSCPNFLKIDNDGTIRFVHQSVKDFFVNGIDGMDLMSSHSSMARICITYLNFKDLPKPINRWSFLRYGDLDEVSKRFSLLYYCSFWLYTHLDNLPTNNTLWVSFSQLLLANKCDAYRRSAYYHPMLLAIDKGSRLLVGSFLKAGCNVNERLNGLPPLHYAIKLNKVDVAFFLLEYGADVNSVDEKNRVPLHFAIQGRDLLLVEKLLAYRELDINVQDSDGRTCLHWAVSEDSGDILRNLLIDKRINIDLVDNNKQTPLVSAAYWGEKLGVQMIVEHSTSLQHHQEMDLSPIICVAQQGWKEMTTELLTRVPNINHHRGLDRKGFLHWAAINNWDEVIQIAIDKAGAKLNQIDSSGKTPLHYAAELGNHAATKRLVRCGASVQISDNIGMTAVQVAAMAGFADVLNLLLQESDYDINASDTNGFSLLHWAASWDWVSIIRIVVEHADVDLSRRNGYGQTALHIAARCGCPSVLQVLLELGYYDINQVDGCGNSLLHLGAKSGSLKVCKDILELPLVDLKRQNNFGQTALNCAEVYDKTGEIPALLTAAGVRFGYASREPPHFIQSQTSHLEWTMLDQKIKQEQQKNPFWGAIQVLAICAFRGCNIMCERSRCKGCLLYYCPQHTSKDSHKCNLRHND